MQQLKSVIEKCSPTFEEHRWLAEISMLFQQTLFSIPQDSIIAAPRCMISIIYWCRYTDFLNLRKMSIVPIPIMPSSKAPGTGITTTVTPGEYITPEAVTSSTSPKP